MYNISGVWESSASKRWHTDIMSVISTLKNSAGLFCSLDLDHSFDDQHNETKHNAGSQSYLGMN